MKKMVVTTVVTVLVISVVLVGLGRITRRGETDDTYEVYSFLLRHEGSNYFLEPGVRREGYLDKSMTFIQEETRSDTLPTGALSGEEARQFKDAIDDYHRVNSQKSLLKPHFQIDHPYEILSSPDLDLLFLGEDAAARLERKRETGQQLDSQDGDLVLRGASKAWQVFHWRYPGSDGYVFFSAVGFNAQKNRAVVSIGRSCGMLCGSGNIHLLQKNRWGKWRDVEIIHTWSS